MTPTKGEANETHFDTQLGQLIYMPCYLQGGGRSLSSARDAWQDYTLTL